jgi:hypothetical protein
VIPCGALLNPPTVDVNDPCITGAGSAGVSASGASAAPAGVGGAQLPPASGSQAVMQILQQELQP